jgi:hypothetical protein
MLAPQSVATALASSLAILFSGNSLYSLLGLLFVAPARIAGLETSES